jgi:gliding motility-associated-like protein
MSRNLRYIFLTFSLLLTQVFLAQKLYWVGGSGNFNDPNHWSQQSGGVGGAKTPTATDDVYFDENSFLDKSIINFIGASEVHDFIFTKYTPTIAFSGLQNEKITINGNVQLNSYIDNQFAGDIWLTSNRAVTNIDFELTTFKSNIYFNGNTNWQIKGDIITDDNSSVYFKQGLFNLYDGVFYSGNLIASSQVTINASQTKFTVKNKFVLPVGVAFNDFKTVIYANIKDATKFQISPTVNFSSSSRLHNLNSVMSACNITLTSQTQPTCLGSCNGTLVFNIPAACSSSSNPIYAQWTSGAGCTQVPTAILTPGSTYTVGGLCGCTQRYTPIFTNDTTLQDSSYSPSTAGGIAIGDPSPPTIQNINVTSFPPKCFGLCNGSIILTIGLNSGTQPLSATWTTPSGTVITHNNLHNGVGTNKDTLKNACAGTYSVFITDANGCKSATSFSTMAQPALVTHTVTPTNILCFGVCNGSANELMAGGTSPFTFTWTTAGTTTSTATSSTNSNLCAGTYTVRTKDAHGCKDSATVVVTQPPNITFTKNPASGLLNIPCLNACNGSVGVNSVSGGTGAYTFSWSPAGGTPINGANSSVYTGLCGSVAGLTYTCTITDSNNCVKTTNFTIKAPPALSHTITGTNPKCNAGSTGSATVTESGGNPLPQYTFSWSPSVGTVSGASPKSIYSNIGGGTYTVVATDGNGCTDTATVTLTPPPVLTASITTIVNPTCPNLNNGQLCVTPGGGTPTYTFTWNPASAGTASCTPATLVSGTYTVTIKDANSCTVTTSATLVPPPSITVTASITEPSCAGLSNGSATLTATGGNGVFSYHWSCSASITNSISGQAGGTTCNYTVTDGNNCKQTGSVSFVSPSPLTLTLTPTTLACNGNCNAQITTGIGGGTPTFSYAWLGTNPVCAACPNQTNMCAGNYTCTVTDFNGCAKTATTTIAAPTPITVTFTPVNPTCAGSCDGSILAVPGGGTNSYPGISWSPALPPPNAPNTLHPINLCAGTYSLQVTDGNFCTVTDTVSLIAPLPVSISLATTSITCAGQNNGTATVTASGGSGSYQYSWDNGITFGASNTQSNLASGTYTVIVKDSKGCLSVAQVFIINQPANLTANAINIINTCNGLCNGGATASVSGGTPGYQYGWDANPFSSGATSINGLCVGTHTLFAKDSNNCITSTTFSISPIINISISSSSTSVSCHNLCDATATGSASGGAGNYTIQWTGPSSSNTCTNVPSGSPCIGVNLCGTSTITATDANGCSNTATVSIANPPALTAVTNTTSVECFGLCTGAATVTPSGGTPSGSAPFYAITWSPGPLPNGTTESNLCPGTYTATITDNNGCQLAQPVTIGVSNQFTVNPTITSPSTCGASDASISLAISGGSGTYTVNWNTGSTANPLNNLSAGTYTATINDANGCDTVIVYGINNLTGPTTTVTVNNNVTCPGQNNGSATVSGSGNGAITVIWPVPNPTGPSPQTGINLSGGITVVQVKDVTGCITNATVTIVAPAIIDDGETVVQPTCGGTLGSITLNPSGGTGSPPYSYNWNGTGFVPGNNTLTNLSPGVDSCVIKDALGCTSQTFIYNINSASTLSLTVNTTSVTCSYSKNGTATANASGSLNPPYTYTWTNSSNVVIAQGTNISNVSALAPGTYSLSVNDASGCNIQTTFTISAPAAINPNFVKNNNLCSFGSTGGATVTPTGGNGVPTYTYLWNTTGNPTTPIVNPITPGSYHVIVYDANNCSDTTFFTITVPSALSMTVASTNPTCFGLANGSATITAVAGGIPFTANGTPPYTLSWGGVGCPTCSVVTNLSGNATYTAIAVDSNGCSVSQTFSLTSPSQISSTFTLTPPTCVGYSNGSITANPSQGVGSYSYQWIPHVAGNVPTANNLPAGTYTLIVTDGNNCTDTTTNILNDPPGLSLIYSSTPATCNQSNGSIIISSANGTGTVSVQWVNPPICAQSYTCNALAAGIYSIKLTDSNGCIDTLTAFVTNTGGPTVTTAANNVTCNGTCNGTASVTVTGGANPFIFTWNSPPTPGSVVNTATTSIASGLCDSSYISIVTDHVGCKTITSFSISQPVQIQDNPNISSATCLGINNGSITSNASGGTPFANGYSYSIDFGPNFGPSVSHTFNNLAAGTHTVSITDSAGCTRNLIYNIPPNSVITSTISSTNVTCSGDCNGTATVLNIVGGTAPITIAWNDGQVGNFATNLCAGSYTATLTDNAGCKAIDTISIIAPSAINPNTVVTNPACGQCNGNITVAPTGGNVGVYTYTWTSPPSNAPILPNICAGPYQVIIADNLGCTQTFQIPVSSSNSPTLTIASTNVACNVPCSGSATVTATGGVTPYTYSWPNVIPVSTSSVVSGLCSNTITPYFAQVKDSLGCIATQTVMITAPQTFTVNNTNVSPSCTVCNGVITLTVTGASTYTCQWSANAGSATTFTVTNLCAGIYTVVVTDIASGCKQTKVIALNNNAGPTLSVIQTDPSCFGMCNGSATVTASFGAGGYTYTWSPSGGNATVASNLCDSTYFVLVTDGAGCVQTSQVNITSLAALIAGLPTVSPIKCNNNCNGSINTVIFGGTPSYTYSWSPSTISGTGGANLCPGNYSVTVTDANGCSVQEFDTLVNPTLLVTTGTLTPASCNNVANGMITTLTSGGTPTYTYQWSGGSNAQTQNLTNVLSGTYTLIATDARACTDTTRYNLPSTITVIANAGRDTALCNNVPLVLTGTVTGTATFNWQDTTGTIIPPVNTLTLSVNPSTTTHYILMAYNGACRDSDTVTVSITPAAIANAGANQSVFFGQTATIGGNPSNPSGGTITWMPNINLSDTAVSNPIASPSVTTTYTLFVTNALGCISSDTMIVIVLPPFNINNGFTPNGDGKNDTWVIDELYKFPNTEIEVYNRWGEQLFYSKGAYTPWNGTYKGSPVPVGTYYYIIRLNDKNYPDHYAGPLTILR